MLEEGTFSAPGREVFDGLHLVHPLARIAELSLTREVIASGLGWALYAQGELPGLGGPLVGAGEVADEGFCEISQLLMLHGLRLLSQVRAVPCSMRGTYFTATCRLPLAMLTAVE